MAVQTSINVAPADGLAGQMATSEGANYSSRQADETIAPGLLVVPTGDNTCALPDAAGEVDGTTTFSLGIAVLDPYRVSADYTEDEHVRICVKGDIFVTVAGAAVAGAALEVDPLTGIPTVGGTIVPGATFLTSGTDTLVAVRLNGQA